MMTRPDLPAVRADLREAVTARFYERYAPLAGGADDTTFPTPWFTVNAGSAGLAYGFYCLWQLTGDESQLRIAENLIDYTVCEIETLALPEECISLRHTSSLFHSDAGPWLVRACIKHALGATAEALASVRTFVACSQRPTPQLDVTVGRSSALLGVALLLERVGDTGKSELTDFGLRLSAQVEAELAAGEMKRGVPLGDMNFAHGWAGVLFALLRSAGPLGRRVAPFIEGLLEELVAVAERNEQQGAWWPLRDTAQAWGHASWCNGAGGHVELWLAASRYYGRSDFADLAADVAYYVGQRAKTVSGSLCCGLVGQAFALLAMYRELPDAMWLQRAHELAELSAQRFLRNHVGEPERHGLFSGEPGAVLLYEALARGRTVGVPLVTW